MTIGVHYKKKFASDSQITEKNSKTGEVVRKILDPGFTKIQVFEKKRRGKSSIKKTIQFAGSVWCYHAALKGLFESGDWFKYRSDIETKCLGNVMEKPHSFRMVFKEGSVTKEWGFLVNKNYEVFEIEEHEVSDNDVHAIGSGSQSFGYGVDSKGITDLNKLVAIAIQYDEYCGGDIIMCKNMANFQTHGQAQLKAVDDLLNGVAAGCFAEASLNADSDIKHLRQQGVKLKPRKTAYKHQAS
ncbi:hypothetical protein J7G25_004182 [Vibrio vulnificus]|nr:hypothetical protein [Vibrio vulnificus]